MMPSRSYDFGIGGGFVAVTAYRWAATLVQEGGHKPSEQVWTVLGLTAGFSAALLLVDYLLWRGRLDRAVRSGLWAAAAIGPYAGLVAWEEWAHPVWGHVAGLVSSVLAFVAFYYLDRALPRRGRSLAAPKA